MDLRNAQMRTWDYVLVLHNKRMREFSLQIWGRNQFWLWFKPDGAYSLYRFRPAYMHSWPKQQSVRLKVKFQLPRALN